MSDTSGLADEIKNYSDGYKVTSVLAVETVMTGGYAGWAGYCVVANAA